MLEKLIFKLGEREIEFTKLEAMQLKNELDSLFGYQYQHVWIPPQWYYPSIPWYTGTTSDNVTIGNSVIDNLTLSEGDHYEFESRN